MVGNLQKTCGICLRTMRGDNLKQHMKRHEIKPYSMVTEYHSTVDVVACNEYKCRDCAYSTDWSYNLRKHERAMHKPLLMVTRKIEYHSTVDVVACNRYKCQDCVYSTNRLSNLRRHEKAMHKPLSMVTRKIEYNSTVDVAACNRYKCHPAGSRCPPSSPQHEGI